MEKLDDKNLPQCIDKDDKKSTKISKIDGDLGGTSFKKTLNPKVEQSRISNLDFETMQWQHVRAFDKNLMQKFNC